LDALRSEARQRRMHADELATAILSAVVADGLYAAILDR